MQEIDDGEFADYLAIAREGYDSRWALRHAAYCRVTTDSVRPRYGFRFFLQSVNSLRWEQSRHNRVDMKYKLVDLKCPHCEKQLGFAWNRKNSLQNGVCPHCGRKAQIQLNLQRSLLALPIALMVGWLFSQLIPFLPALFLGTIVFGAGAMEFGKQR